MAVSPVVGKNYFTQDGKKAHAAFRLPSGNTVMTLSNGADFQVDARGNALTSRYLDLVSPATRLVEGWVNPYPSDKGVGVKVGYTIFSTKEKALRAKDRDNALGEPQRIVLEVAE